MRPERDDQAAPPSAYPDFGKYPEYVKRNFRVKALGLAAMQLLIVLCIMALVTSLGLERTWDTFAALLAMIMALVLAMTLLAMFKVDYPKNYILLLFVTVLAGLVWGTGGAMLPERMHFQIVGSMFVTMAFSCVFVQALAEAFKHRPRELVVASLFGAWAVSVVAIVATTGLLGVHVVHMMCSIAISFGLMVLFMLQGGYLLIECDPDTFMAFVVAMDSTLLAIVALPVLWACGLTLCVFCFLGETTEVEEEAAAAENAPADDPAFYHPDLHVV